MTTILNWADVHKKIDNSSHQFSLLQNHFNKFFGHIEVQLSTPHLQSKGIQSQKYSDAIFTSNFAGRDLTFVFTAIRNESETLVGRVTCYVLSKFPEEKYILIDSFDFSTSGKTKFKIGDANGDPAQINHDSHALCIFLEVLYKSLSY